MKTRESIIKMQLRALLEGDEYLCPDPIFDYDKFYRLGITNVEVKADEENIAITLTLEKPGLFIGVGGKTLDNVIERLSKWSNKKVTINIKESNIWR